MAFRANIFNEKMSGLFSYAPGLHIPVQIGRKRITKMTKEILQRA